MKIDPTDRSPQLTIQTVDVQKKNGKSVGFGSVLQDTIERSKQPNSSPGQAIQQTIGTMPLNNIHPNPVNEQCTSTASLIDNLEHYQKMLADPEVTLRMLQPAVDRMSQMAADSAALLNRLPDGHPLRMILQETMSTINIEIERFSSGYYVDR